MNKFSAKLLSVLAIILFIAIIPIAVLATNENVSLVSTQSEGGKQEYIIYIKDYTEKKFKYAFSNNEKPEEMDLVYINSITTNVDEDQKSNEVAFLDTETYEKLSSQTIYMWAKDENENLILDGIQLDFQNSITKDEIDLVEATTQRIKVKIADSKEESEKIRNEDIDGVEETASVGYVEIVDNEEATYYYQKVKLPASEDYNKLMKLAEQIKNEYNDMDMYEKIQIGMEYYNLYSRLITGNQDWEKVEKMIIEQPEESVAGDKYILFLKKVETQRTENEEVETVKIEETELQTIETIDVQFLTAEDDYEPTIIKEQKITQETAKLPITYDSIALIVILAVVVVALILVFIRMKKLNKQDEEK